MTLKKRSRLATRLLLLLVVLLALAPLSSAEWKEKVLYSFQGGNDGSFPGGGVVFDQQGNLYGVTQAGGPPSCDPIGSYCGTVYKLSPSAKGGPWTKTLLYMFKGKRYNDGEVPDGLIIDQAGNLYGVTAYGGTGGCVLVGVPAGCGTVYELSPPQSKGGKWTYTILYSFKSGKDGYLPGGNLVFDSAGNLYGTTDFGGGKGTTCDPYYQYCGTVFELSPPKTKGGKWTEKVLHSFAGGTDGANPNGGLVLDIKGNVYGTTPIGGNQSCDFGHGQIGCGIAFKVSPPAKRGEAWAEKVIHRFTGGTDGATPDAGFTPSKDGSLYGPSGGGGKYDRGLVFHLTKTNGGGWMESVLYDFVGNQAGQNPGQLTFGSDGNLYGAAAGGQSFNGLIFRLTDPVHGNSWRLSVLYNFMPGGDGAGPESGLIFDGAGNLYGTTVVGGGGTGCTNGCGTVYEASP